MTSIAFVPFVRETAGYGWAFALPCLCMTIALMMFLSKRKSYIHQKANGHLVKTFRIAWQLAVQQILISYPWLAARIPFVCRPSLLHVKVQPEDDKDGDINAEESAESMQLVEDAAQALRTIPILAMFPIFWSLYDQQGSVWTLQATVCTCKKRNLIGAMYTKSYLFPFSVLVKIVENGASIRNTTRAAQCD
jgi:dipeptide/tripeptide permease